MSERFMNHESRSNECHKPLWWKFDSQSVGSRYGPVAVVLEKASAPARSWQGRDVLIGGPIILKPTPTKLTNKVISASRFWLTKSNENRKVYNAVHVWTGNPCALYDIHRCWNTCHARMYNYTNPYNLLTNLIRYLPTSASTNHYLVEIKCIQIRSHYQHNSWARFRRRGALHKLSSLRGSTYITLQDFWEIS